MEQRINVRLSDETFENLQYFAKQTPLTASMIIRELIQPPAVVDAIIENLILHSLTYMKGEPITEGTERRLARPTTFQLQSLAIGKLVSEMLDKNEKYKIGIQYEILCGSSVMYKPGSDDDLNVTIAQLYRKWARAKRGVDGYHFEGVIYQGKERFNIAIGPDDSDETIELLKKEIVDYAEKLGL